MAVGYIYNRSAADATCQLCRVLHARGNKTATDTIYVGVGHAKIPCTRSWSVMGESVSTRRAQAQHSALKVILADSSFFDTLLEAVQKSNDGTAVYIALKDFQTLLGIFFSKLSADLITDEASGIIRNIRRYIDPSLFSRHRHRFHNTVSWDPSRTPGHQGGFLELKGLPDPPTACSLRSKIVALVRDCAAEVKSSIACKFTNPGPFTAGYPDSRHKAAVQGQESSSAACCKGGPLPVSGSMTWLPMCGAISLYLPAVRTWLCLNATFLYIV